MQPMVKPSLYRLDNQNGHRNHLSRGDHGCTTRLFFFVSLISISPQGQEIITRTVNASDGCLWSMGAPKFGAYFTQHIVHEVVYKCVVS